MTRNRPSDTISSSRPGPGPSRRALHSAAFAVLTAVIAVPAAAIGDEPEKPAAEIEIAQASLTPVRSDSGASETRSEVHEAAEPVVIHYNPPRRGSPRGRVGAGLRTASAHPRALALAPDHVAETVSAQPSLFWHIDGLPRGDSELIFTLLEEEGDDPVAEIRLAQPTGAGIQRIRLADLGVSLRPDREYEWSVSLVVASGPRSHDAVTTGYIRRVAEPLELAARAPGVESYAELGLWYDALESVSDSIDARPSDSSLREQRSALLRQANLVLALD